MSQHAKVEDLGYIKIRTVGGRDVILLGHNEQQVAIVQVHPSFYLETPFKWAQVFDVYRRFKRESHPELQHELWKDHPWKQKGKLTAAVRKRKFFGQDVENE